MSTKSARFKSRLWQDLAYSNPLDHDLAQTSASSSWWKPLHSRWTYVREQVAAKWQVLQAIGVLLASLYLFMGLAVLLEERRHLAAPSAPPAAPRHPGLNRPTASFPARFFPSRWLFGGAAPKCERGRVDRDGRWVERPAETEGKGSYWWVPAVPFSHDLQQAAACLAGESVAVVGDSTARFFFSAMVDALHISRKARQPALPLHFLPSSDRCSFPLAGWQPTKYCKRSKTCCSRWRSQAYLPEHPMMEACEEAGDGRKKTCASYEWIGKIDEGTARRLAAPCPTTNTSDADTDTDTPDVVFVGVGLWDAKFTMDSVDKIALRLQELLSRVRSQCRAADEARASRQRHVLLGPSPCPNTKGDGNDRPDQVQRVVDLNAAFAAVASKEGWLYVDRSASQASAPRMPTSMCHKHHAHGYLSDLHVQMALNIVCDSRTSGCPKPGSSTSGSWKGWSW